MLRLLAGQAESLWDEALPVEVRELPDDLAQLDRLLGDPDLLGPVVAHWEREASVSGRSAAGHGRPTIAIETYVRLMVLKHRHGWGYRTLVAEVSDSIHLRRFCRIALSERVPDESTVRKLTRRLGPETVAELTRVLISKAAREKRFRGRGGCGRRGKSLNCSVCRGRGCTSSRVLPAFPEAGSVVPLAPRAPAS